MGDNQKLYMHAAKVLDGISEKKGLAKQLCLQSSYPRKKPLLALVTHTLRFYPVLSELMNRTNLQQKERKLSRHLLIVLIHDAIVGKGVKCGGLFKNIMSKYKSVLSSEVIKMKVRAGVREIIELLPVERRVHKPQPRYARINELIVDSIESGLQKIVDAGFIKVDASTQDHLLELKPGTFAQDPHLEDLVAFAPTTDLHDSSLYTEGVVILQDKASCIPAYVLDPPEGSVCIDACAAPGNKTSHLAAKLRNNGRVFAFDLDSRRMKLLERLTTKAGATCIRTRNMSFLDVNVESPEYVNVTHALVDPSCSGSGMAEAFEQELPPLVEPGRKRKRVHSGNDNGAIPANAKAIDENTRAEQLAEFQIKCVLKAMSFPNVKRVSYSTCSVHEIENEKVVEYVLKQRPDFETVAVLPAWHRRGIRPDIYQFADHVLRANRSVDGTTGFFVALFARKSTSGISNVAAPTMNQSQRTKKKKKKKKQKKSKK